MASINFAELDLRGAFDLAIMIEEDAQLRYQDFAKLLGTRDELGAAAVFRAMAINEAKHRNDLESRRRIKFRHDPRIEISVLDQGEGEAPDESELTPSMTARDALDVCLRAEIRAYDFYAGALPYVQDPDVRVFFEELKEEEVEHQELLRKKIAELDAAGRGRAVRRSEG
jgi:erythrin-vacuolar iron transport family protein